VSLSRHKVGKTQQSSWQLGTRRQGLSIEQQQQQQQQQQHLDNNTLRQQQAIIMSSSYVWVQLYYEEQGKAGNPIKIRPIPEDVADLAEAVKDKMAEELMHCSPARLDVYPPKSSGDREKQYGPDKEMKEVIRELKKKTPPTSGKHPLIVVAPPPPQQPQANMVRRFSDWVRYFVVDLFNLCLLTINLPTLCFIVEFIYLR
jgi:hypothetical protein